MNIRPDKPIKHFTAYDPIAKWTIGRVSGQASARRAKSLLDKLLIEAPFAVRGIQVEGGAECKSAFEAEGQARGLELFVLPQKRPDLNGGVERAQSTWRYEFYATYICRIASISCRPSSTPSPIDSTTIGRTTRLPDKPHQSIAKLSAKATHAVSYVASPDTGLPFPCLR